MTDETTLQKLLAAGYSPTTLANALDLDVENVTELALAERRGYEAEDDLMESARQMVRRVIDEAFLILDEANMQTKIALISKLSTPLFKMMYTEGDELGDMRAQLAELTAALRKEHGGEVEQPGQSTDDPDEEA